MKEAECPLPFWDYCIERRERINNLTIKDLFQLKGRNHHYSVTGEEGDISNLYQFKFIAGTTSSTKVLASLIQKKSLGAYLVQKQGGK